MAFVDSEDADWDMLGEDTLLNKGGGDSAGWGDGVDASLYTTNISGVSSDLRAKAKEMARQIIGEKKGGARRQNNSNNVVPAYVLYHMFNTYITHHMTTNSVPVPTVDDTVAKISSAEEAMKILQLQHKKQQQQAKKQQRPAMSTKENERAAYDFCKAQLSRVRANLRKFGEPNPGQCGKFLRMLTSGLVERLRFPRPAVRGPCSQAFKNCSWDIRKNRSVVGSRPPKGSDLELLVFRLVSFFAKIFGEAAPPAAPKRAPMRGGSRRGQPRRRHQRNGGGVSSNNNNQDKGESGDDKTRKPRRGGNNRRRQNARTRRNSKNVPGGSTRQNTNGGTRKTRPRGGVRGAGGRDNGNKN
jgi:hypothetical protein